jgi:hypothetical protein
MGKARKPNNKPNNKQQNESKYMKLKSIKSWFAALAVAVVAGVLVGGEQSARADVTPRILQTGANVVLESVQPSPPAWGQPAQYSVLVLQNGAPVRKATLKCGFFDKNGHRMSWGWKTDNNGRAVFTKTIPLKWKAPNNWVKLIVSCDKAGGISIAARGEWFVK